MIFITLRLAEVKLEISHTAFLITSSELLVFSICKANEPGTILQL